MKEYVLKMKKQCIQSRYFYMSAMIFLSSCFSLVQAAEATEAILGTTSPLLQEQDIQQELANMKTRLNTRIEDWGKTLTPNDFEWTWRGRMLKQSKRIEVCNIFQNVINETYRLMIKHKSNLNEANQKVLEDRNTFIQQLGINDHTIPTQMGFSCVVK